MKEGKRKNKYKGHTKAQNENLLTGRRLKDRIRGYFPVFEILYKMDDILGAYKLVKLASMWYLQDIGS